MAIDVSEAFAPQGGNEARLEAAKRRMAQTKEKKAAGAGQVGSLLGAAIGAYVGGPAGAQLGGSIGNQAGRVAGGGELDVKKLAGSASDLAKLSGDKKDTKGKKAKKANVSAEDTATMASLDDDAFLAQLLMG